MSFYIPSQVIEILSLLEEHSYKAYFVGECVRVLISGGAPLDYDIVTNAPPTRIQAIFEDKYRTSQGNAPGELIIINGAKGISVTPYRCLNKDGKQEFCSNIDDDLKRRVYTADAIAYHPETGIYDPFNGSSCISEDKVILRTIGEAENPLLSERKQNKNKPEVEQFYASLLYNSPITLLSAILRYARGEAELSQSTCKFICGDEKLITNFTPRQKLMGLKEVLLGKYVTDALLLFRKRLFRLIPRLAETDGLDQRSMAQEYDLFEHTAKSVGLAVPDFTIRLALLLHGIGKPDCEAVRSTHNTYHGHTDRGAMLAREALFELEAPPELVQDIQFLILFHDTDVNENNYTAYAAEFGTERIRKLLLMQAANLRAKNSERSYEQRAAELRALSNRLEERRPRNNTVTLTELKRLAEQKKFL